MAMVTQIDEATGVVTGTWATGVTSAKWNTVDTNAGTTPIATPTSTGTNFSFIKTFSMDIVTVNSLNMTALKVGKVANEATLGTKLWVVTSHSTYTQATAAPGATGDNNSTAPTMNGATGALMGLISGASAYGAGPFNSTGRLGNLVEVCLGVDSTNTTAGTTVATPTLRWSWTEG